jgi:hypothetical protein
MIHKPPPNAQRYELRLKGHLDAQWITWFDGLTMTLEENGNTLLSGPVADQAALHGLLKKVRDSGMTLVSVNQVQLNETHSYRSEKGENMNINEKNALNSPKRLARIAGVLYLVVAIFAGFAFNVFTGLYVAGNAAATTANVVASAGLVRVAVVADLIQVTAWVFLALTLYRLLQDVHPGAAFAMVTLVAIGAGIACFNNVFAFEGMRVVTDGSYAAVLGVGGANALVLMLFDIQHYGVSIVSVFYGLWLVPLGYLVYKSGMFPKTLGVALIAVCVCYHTKLLAAFLAPDLWTVIQGYVSIPIWVFELWMVLYLLIIGVKTAKPDAHPRRGIINPVDGLETHTQR